MKPFSVSAFPSKPMHLARPLRVSLLGAVVVAAALLSACSSKPPVPDWQMNAQGSAQKALEAYLSGNPRVEQLEWDRARAEVARTGRPDLLARLELMRCAAQVASLVPGPCERFEPLRADAAAPERAYADYLGGLAARSAAQGSCIGRCICIARFGRPAVAPRGGWGAVSVGACQPGGDRYRC